MALLSRRWTLLDVDDVEALAWKLVGSSGQVAGLQPHQRDDLCSHVITVIWEASLRYDAARNVRFSTFAYTVGQRSIVNWFRSTANGFGRTRWTFGDGRVHERKRPELVPLDSELVDTEPARSGDPAFDSSPDLGRLLSKGRSTRARDLESLGLDPT